MSSVSSGGSGWGGAGSTRREPVDWQAAKQMSFTKHVLASMFWNGSVSYFEALFLQPAPDEATYLLR